MEILSFAFGMLSMVAVTLVAVIVLGMVRVIKMQSTIKDLFNSIDRLDAHVHTRMTNEYNTLNRVITDDRKELNSRIDDLNRYVDSRFDKMENKFISKN